MDLLKEEKRLVEKLIKTRQVAGRKLQYLTKAQRSLMMAQREVKAAETRVRKIRKQIRVQGVEYLAVPGSLDYPDEPVTIHTPSVKPTPVEEENTD